MNEKMEIRAFLAEITAKRGDSGFEGPVAGRIFEEFQKYSKEVSIDKLGNVSAQMGEIGEEGKKGPTVLVCAHMDEIGLIVTGIEENGFLRFWQIGGVDPHILPGGEVIVHGKEDLFGVIGHRPPHLSSSSPAAARLDELCIDIGLPKSKAEALVRVGDPISFRAPLTRLLNERVAGKTFDDRACVTAMIVAMEELSRVKLRCRVRFVATVQEEVGVRGAKVAAQALEPDLAVAFDVCHANMPGASPWETMPLGFVSLGKGPTLHPALFRRLEETAGALGIAIQADISSGRTHTDADSAFLANSGVPTALISLPLAYMHTMVETIALRDVREAGRLLAGFLKGVDEDWRDWLCV
ncbi:MAG: M20/M25/M40 family metallo-hydrolase [Christensenellaceae bacterium]|jgi:endoglucanase|nr:M20/M25/M40 family metallo-hydrolase [Christensenellaceae bacterium]